MKFVAFCLFLFTLIPITFSKKSYQLILPKSDAGTFPHAKLLGTIDRPLNEFTICHWSRSAIIRPTYGTIFSYSVANTDNLIRTMVATPRDDNKQKFFFLGLHLQSPYIDIGENKLNWLHTCVTSTTLLRGRWSVYFNGNEAVKRQENVTEKAVPPNGAVVLGVYTQNETSLYDAFKFYGQIADVYMWNRILTPQEVAAVYNCSGTEDASIVNWNLHTWRLFNGAKIASVELPCGRK